MSQPVPPEITEAANRLTQIIVTSGELHQTIDLERVGAPGGSTIETFRLIASLVSQQWAPPARLDGPWPAYDWRVRYNPDDSRFVATSRRLLTYGQMH